MLKGATRQTNEVRECAIEKCLISEVALGTNGTHVRSMERTKNNPRQIAKQGNRDVRAIYKIHRASVIDRNVGAITKFEGTAANFSPCPLNKRHSDRR